MFACWWCPDAQAALAEDVNGVANKLITLKAYYPNADVFAISVSRPKTLMQSEDSIRENAEQVCRQAGHHRSKGSCIPYCMCDSRLLPTLCQAVAHLAAPPRLLEQAS
jgi:hypothetical protein